MISYDKKINNAAIYWLSCCLSLLFLIVIVGGLTRLTNSGLSITEWEILKGIFPPMNKNDWEAYFDAYKRIPQYELINSSMTLGEFKVIFYWEYAHRILARLIGIFFLVPLIYFYFTKKIKNKQFSSYYFVAFLIILQGLVGWYMVKSGLVNDITVSHYRLSLHLTIAILIISIIYWQILILTKNKFKYFFNFSKEKLAYLALIFLIFLQIIFGAFVSGLDAGKIYQTWPLMGEKYFPDDLLINSVNDLINFETHSLLQFYHRNLAYLISFYIIVLSFYILKKKDYCLYKPLILLILTLTTQIILGIFTLLSDLHIVLASAHQITSIILVLSVINLYYYSIK